MQRDVFYNYQNIVSRGTTKATLTGLTQIVEDMDIFDGALLGFVDHPSLPNGFYVVRYNNPLLMHQQSI